MRKEYEVKYVIDEWIEDKVSFLTLEEAQEVAKMLADAGMRIVSVEETFVEDY